MSLAAQVALERWRAMGQRTLARLDDLCERYAEVYALPAEIVKHEARRGVRDWEVQS